MYHVYLLKSRKDNRLYVGYTYESFRSLEDAKKREKALKHFGKAYAQLKARIMNSLKGAG